MSMEDETYTLKNNNMPMPTMIRGGKTQQFYTGNSFASTVNRFSSHVSINYITVYS